MLVTDYLRKSFPIAQLRTFAKKKAQKKRKPTKKKVNNFRCYLEILGVSIRKGNLPPAAEGKGAKGSGEALELEWGILKSLVLGSYSFSLMWEKSGEWYSEGTWNGVARAGINSSWVHLHKIDCRETDVFESGITTLKILQRLVIFLSNLNTMQRKCLKLEQNCEQGSLKGVSQCWKFLRLVIFLRKCLKSEQNCEQGSLKGVSQRWKFLRLVIFLRKCLKSEQNCEQGSLKGVSQRWKFLRLVIFLRKCLKSEQNCEQGSLKGVSQRWKFLRLVIFLRKCLKSEQNCEQGFKFRGLRRKVPNFKTGYFVLTAISLVLIDIKCSGLSQFVEILFL